MKKQLQIIGVVLLLFFGSHLFDRTIEYAQAAFGGWSASYNSLPADSENIALGASRIRSVKTETMLRGQVEHNWGTVNHANDDGLHLEGSGVAFWETTAPSTLKDPGARSLATLGTRADGRLWIDPDGGPATNDNFRFYAYDGTAQVFREIYNPNVPKAVIGYAEDIGTSTTVTCGSDNEVLQVSVAIPSNASNYVVAVSAALNAATGASTTSRTILFGSIWEDDCAGGAYVRKTGSQSRKHDDGNIQPGLHLSTVWANTNPPEGATCRYRVTANCANNTSVNLNNPAGNNLTSNLVVQVLPSS